MSCYLAAVKRGGARDFRCLNRKCRKFLRVDWYSSYKEGDNFGNCPHCGQDITFNVTLVRPVYYLTANKFTEADSLPKPKCETNNKSKRSKT